MTEREQGFTLAELAVTVVILSVATLMIFGFLDSTTTLTGRSTSNVRAEQDGQIALRTITQDVRAANPIMTGCAPVVSGLSGYTPTSFTGGYADCLTFEVKRPAVSGGTPGCPKSLITYGLIGGAVREDRIDFDAGCTPSLRFRGHHIIDVVNPAGILFSYFDRAGRSINLSSTTPVDAGSVRIRLTVKYYPTAPTLDLTSYAAIRNNRS